MSPRLPDWAARLLGRRGDVRPGGSAAPGEKTPGSPALPDNPYRRFYTRQRRLEELTPRPPKPKK